METSTRRMEASERNDYQAMVESITDYEVIRLDVEGNIRSWHKGAENLKGYTAEEVLGEHVSIFYTEEDKDRGLADIELRTAEKEGRFQFEGWRLRKGGSAFWANVILTPIRDAHGELTGFVKVAQDLTERRAQEESLHAVQAMVESITDYEVIRLDVEGNIRSWHKGAENLKGYTAEEVLGEHVSIFYTEEDKDRGLADIELRTAEKEGRFQFEGWRLRKGGSAFWANVILTPIRDAHGELTGFVKVAQDLTERRAQEQLVLNQRDEILMLSTPVMQVWDKVLVLPVIGTLESDRAARLTESLLMGIAELGAEVVIIDISGVPTVDTAVAHHLLKTVAAAGLMGATSVLSGVRPETAQSMVHLGIELGGVQSRNTLRGALQLALDLIASGTEPSGRRSSGA